VTFEETKTKKEGSHDKQETGKGEVEILKSKSETSPEGSNKKRKTGENDPNQSKKAK